MVKPKVSSFRGHVTAGGRLGFVPDHRLIARNAERC